ncbi:MAG: ribonuclease Z [Candidatus Omnitrophica bacterium]|nr:ribonuclease Z [Candidatus Omnitrophota bacterium]
MKIHFLGTNGWYDTRTGNTLSVLIETAAAYIILDAGNGFYKIDRYIKAGKPVYLFLSHFHLDHIAGLHVMVKFKFPQGMDIYGPAGTRKYLNSIVRKPFTVPFSRLTMRTTLNDLVRHPAPAMPVDVEFKRLDHASICYGYRFRLEGKVVTFCTDTGVCRNLVSLARDADILITECALRSGMENKKWPHLNPESAAQVAKDAGAERLALVHFDAYLYTTFAERKKALHNARKIFKNTEAPLDGQTIVL